MPAALITGASKRLGREMALYMAGRGYDIAVHYSGSKDDAEQTVADCIALGVLAAPVQADLLDLDAAEGLVGRAVQAVGALDVLINNASIFDYDRLETATQDGWDRHFRTNLQAPFILIQNFAAQAPKASLDENGEPVAGAVVINMVDQRVQKLTPEFMTYTLAKTGLWTLTQTAAQALAPDVRVNAIGPGPTLQGTRQSDAHFAGQRAGTLLRRGSSPKGICQALGYFLDADDVTGQLICVDGGQNLGWKTPDIQGVETASKPD